MFDVGRSIVLKDFVDGDEAVGGFDGVDVRVVFVRGKLTRATRHFEDELASGNIPEGDAGFHIGIEPAAGGVGHGEGGAAHHAHFATTEGGFAKAFESDFERFLIFTATDEDDGFFQLGASADAKGFAIEKDFATFLGGPCFVSHGVMDDSHENIFSLSKRDGDAEVGNAVKEIYGAIDGVDDPLVFGVLIAAETFFAVQGVIWVVGSDTSKDEILSFAVEFQLEVMMLRFIDGFVLMKMVAKELAYFLSGADGSFEISHGKGFSRVEWFWKEGA